jgi:hypothetical protein
MEEEPVTLRTRVERLEAELLGKAVKVGSPTCICFPANEEPVFRTSEDRAAAAKVKCPLHGERFPHRIDVFVAGWRWEREIAFRWPRLSAQYHKAWKASFPPNSTPEVLGPNSRRTDGNA